MAESLVDKKLGILCTSGLGPAKIQVNEFLQELEKRSTYVVAADSGYLLAEELGLHVDILVGDMDSLAELGVNYLTLKCRYEKSPVAKDYTDTQLAMRHLEQESCSSIVQLGGGGKRADHFLALFYHLLENKSPQRWFTNNEELVLIEQGATWVFNSYIGRTVSFFPLCANCKISSSGLRWPLDHRIWNMGDFSISNSMLREEISIELLSGRLAVLIPHEVK